MNAFDALLREALMTTAVIAVPILSVAALVGTAVAVLQAATQVQEQTLTLLPKIVAVAATVAIFGSFAMRLLIALFTHAVSAIPAIASGP
jgi:flagellar biosynthesis protein FliQ